ncbi:hypothetical protein RB195_010431 [Necator americanus]|uniref:Cytosolic endo-beta-N-acetylglucosaminidase TIM barrel domain-containing protein n=1 Tax=Necator americanus TaxID=51031 RepID=A0ABR1CXY2_NECAM
MVKPICSLEALWEWEPERAEAVQVRRLANFRDKLTEGRPETLICHDMKGGYLEEESDEGIFLAPESSNPYVFLNWWNIDIFCYFSHNFVTIPPTSYTNIAHDHGCLVLGTFITEWEVGAALCKHFLASEDSVRRTVQLLVAIARHYKFDGWLVNIENEVPVKQINNLKTFLRSLTDSMHVSCMSSRVIWYDSVTVTGKLSWQNKLNELNREWYDSCDGIYLNYNWDDEMLLNSADFGAINRIFVGVDVFARGCVGLKLQSRNT